MTTKNLGRIRMNPRGTYDPLLAYDRLDLVTLQGESWIAKGPVPVGESPAGIEENTYWQRVFTDEALRQDLAGEPANGAGALRVRGAVIYVDTIADLQALPTAGLIDGQAFGVVDVGEVR